VRLLYSFVFVLLAGVVCAAPKDVFPRSEKDIGFGKTLESFGIKDVRTVHAKDFGWNAKNATKALQKALDSKATTVVVDAMPSPWVVDTIAVRSKQRILLKKGVRIYRDRTSPDFHKKPMFVLSQTHDVIIEGEETEDCVLAAYESAEARKAHFAGEGASIFRFDRAKNTVIRNLKAIRSEQDGASFGGDMHVPSVDTWIENVDFTGNARQGMSIVVAKGVYCKNVKFAWTQGAQPMAGIDLEPCYPVNYNTDLYLFDCLFEGNSGGGIIFANMSQYPVRAYAGRCRFTQLVAAGVTITPRGQYYIPLGKKADGKLVFEDCTFETFANIPAINYVGAPLFDVTFKNLVIRDTGKMSWCDAPGTYPPINFELNCDYRKAGKGFRPELTGVTTFEGATVTSPAAELISFCDELGVQPVEKAFAGKVKFNGKALDTAGIGHKALDLDEPVLARVPAKAIRPKGNVKGKPAAQTEGGGNMALSWDGRWYEHLPAYTYYFWAEKGKPVSFTLTYPKKTHWDGDMAKALAGKHLKLDTAAGPVDLGAMAVGQNRVSFTPKKSGWCVMFPPGQDSDAGNAVRVGDVEGASFAWQGDTLESSQAKFTLKDKERDYVGYFEVPPKAECRLAVMGGSFEVRNPSGKVVTSCKKGTYVGRHVFTFKAVGTKSEIWSFRALPGDGRRTLRFYAPLNGIWADTPESLPLQVRK